MKPRLIGQGFYTARQLKKIGFKSIGTNVLISKRAVIHSPEKIEIGSNVRIDDFCTLSGNIKLGNHIHIAGYTSLYGNSGIVLEDFANISSNVRVYSETDDFSGNSLMGPCVPMKYRLQLHKSPVVLKKHSIIASTCVVLPGVTLGEGAAVGCFSLISTDCEPWKVYVGNPLRILKDRKKKILE